MDLSDRLARIEEIAHQAGDVLCEYFRSDRIGTKAKGQRDVVTAADFASESLIRSALQADFPDDGIVAEEGTRIPGSNGLCWYVDPLDGTLNYSRGLGIWCVSIALFRGDLPILGVIHDPLRAETFTATTTGGAQRNGEDIACSQVHDAKQAVVHMTIDFDEQAQQSGLDDIRLVAPAVMRTRNIGSAALSLAYVALGVFDAMLHRSANPWDYGAGVALVRQAGGCCTAIDGGPFTASTRTLAAASTPDLHASLVSCITRAKEPTIQ